MSIYAYTKYRFRFRYSITFISSSTLLPLPLRQADAEVITVIEIVLDQCRILLCALQNIHHLLMEAILVYIAKFQRRSVQILVSIKMETGANPK